MIAEAARAKGKLHLRYEDVAQDGRVLLETIPVSLGVVWRELTIAPEVRSELLGRGIIPILTRFEIEGAPGPFAIEAHLDVEGGYTLASSDIRGAPRVILEMDVTVSGRKGRTNLPPPEDVGTPAVAGTLRAEHVFTRPFAPAGQRAVTSLELGGRSFVPGARRAWRPATTALELPAGGRAVDGAFVEDPVVWPMGLTHTDSNQHVNSLVYPRLFEEVALRRLVAHGRSTAVLARSLDIAFRRPSFAGERLRALAQLHEHEGRIVCIGAFFGEGDALDLAKARVYVRMTLE
jgi:hypothetical protein